MKLFPKFLLALLFCLLATVTSHAQLNKYVITCQQNGQAVVTSGVTSSTKHPISYTSAPIRIYQTGTTTDATLYSDVSGITPLANPNTCNSVAQFTFYTSEISIDWRLSPSGVTPFTTSGIGPNVISYASKTRYGITALSVNPVSSTNPIAAAVEQFGNVVNVRTYVTGGSGTQGSPWTGWATSVTWSQNTTYFFPDGWYSYSTSPQWGHIGLRLIGGKSTYLKFTGTGVVADLTARDTPTGYGFLMSLGLGVDDITFVGNSNATIGLDISGCQGCVFRNVRVGMVTTAAFKGRFLITALFDSCKHTTHDVSLLAATPLPTNVFLFDDRGGASEPSNNITILNPTVEDASGFGIVIQGHGQNTSIYGGVAEANAAGGISIASTVLGTTIRDTYVESNGTQPDILNNGKATLLDGVLSNQEIKIGATAKLTVLRSCKGQQLTIDAGADGTEIRDYTLNIASVNATPVVDAGTNTKNVGFLLDYASGSVVYYDGTTDWTLLTLINSFTNVGAPSRNLSYRKDAIGNVEVDGEVTGGVAGTVIAVLPVGFRPTTFIVRSFTTNTGANGVLTIDTSGNISWNSGGATPLYVYAKFPTN